MLMKFSTLKNLFYLLLIWTFTCQMVEAQSLSTYQFSSSSNTFNFISGGTLLGKTTATTGNVPTLDKAIYVLPSGTIPFSFKFENSYFTGLTVNSNGFITFGTLTQSTSLILPLSDNSAFSGVLAPMANDLNGFYSATDTTKNSEIRYEVLGTSPSRIFVVQWKYMRPWSSATTLVNYLNFQVRLYETSNAIEFCYGNVGTGFSTSAAGNKMQVGIRGINNTFPTNVMNRSVVYGTQTSWLNSVAGTANSSDCSIGGTLNPSNIVYRFAPPSCPPPAGFAATYVTKTNATISWTPAVSALKYKVEYGLNGFTLGSGTKTEVTSNTIDLTGLSAQTTYQIYIRQFCSLTDSSSIQSFIFSTGKDGEDCLTATSLSLQSFPTTVAYSSVASGVSLNAPNNICSDSIGKVGDDDVWYKFIAPNNLNSKIVVTTQAGTINDWVMEVWTDCPSTSNNAYRCSDDVNGFMPEVTLCQNEYTPGATYYVRIWTYARNASGTCGLAVYTTTACPLPPSNDECSTATSISIHPPQSCPASAQTFTNVNATVSSAIAQSCDAATAGYTDVWFKFNTGNFGDINLTITPGTAVGLKAALLFECGGFEIQCYSNANGTYALNGLNPQADYILRIWTPATGTPGTFNLCLADQCDVPTAAISGSYSICSGATVQAKVDLTGYAPWTFVYTDGTSNYSVSTSTTPCYINLSPITSKNYNLVSVTGPYCSGTVSGTASINVSAPPVVTLANLGFTCSNSSKILTQGSPSGGTYSGLFVQSGSFFGNLSGPGTFNVTYTYGLGIGCQRSATNSINVYQAPVITSFSPATGPVGTDVGISGYNFTGVNGVQFNGVSATQFNVINDLATHATVPVNATTGTIKLINSNGCFTTTSNPFGVGVPTASCTVNIKVFIEGFYAYNSTLTPVSDAVNAPLTSDTISVSLYSSAFPYSHVTTKKTVLGVDGHASVSFPSVYSGGSYYLVINHRNSIETWSKNPVVLPLGGISYNFTAPNSFQRSIKTTVNSTNNGY
ncbi:MAG: fibronectin type III domain-containing protein [Bacteroidota bacterium]